LIVQQDIPIDILSYDDRRGDALTGTKDVVTENIRTETNGNVMARCSMTKMMMWCMIARLNYTNMATSRDLTDQLKI
jgi:hypothetical protein